MPTPEIMTRLRKLIPLLASDKAGEVTAAASMITRTLSGAGLDWHDLVKWLMNGQSTAPRSNSHSATWNTNPQPRSRPNSKGNGFSGFGDEPPDWKPSFNSQQYQGLAKRILAADTTYLSAMELEFLNNATEWNAWATFKQERWIRKIAAKMHITP
jgi:hypothetical protein